LFFLSAVLAFLCSSSCILLLLTFVACLSSLLFFSLLCSLPFFAAVLVSFFSLLFSLVCYRVASRRCSRCFLFTVLAIFFLVLLLVTYFRRRFLVLRRRAISIARKEYRSLRKPQEIPRFFTKVSYSQNRNYWIKCSESTEQYAISRVQYAIFLEHLLYKIR